MSSLKTIQVNSPDSMPAEQVGLLNMILKASGYEGLSRKDFLRKFFRIKAEDGPTIAANLRHYGLMS